MPGRYASRASKFLYLDGARMTGEAGPLTKSESETELLTEKILPEGSARAVVVQSGISNEMIALEGYARRDSGAANLILSDDAHAVAATPERLVTRRRVRRCRRPAGGHPPRDDPGGRLENHPWRSPAAIRGHAQDGARAEGRRAGGDNHPRNGEVIRGKRHGCCRYQNADSWTSARSLRLALSWRTM